MPRGDVEAWLFGAIIAVLLVGGTILIAVEERRRNAACAELGGIIVNLKCGRFVEIGQDGAP